LQPQANQIVDDRDEEPKFRPSFAASKALLSDHRFQITMWTVAHSVYLIASNILKHERPGQSMSQDIQQKFTKVKKVFETLA